MSIMAGNGQFMGQFIRALSITHQRICWLRFPIPFPARGVATLIPGKR